MPFNPRADWLRFLRRPENRKARRRSTRRGHDRAAAVQVLEDRCLLSGVSGAVFADADADGFRDTDVIQGDEPDVVFVLDASESTQEAFEGTPVGDLNGDGIDNSILDAEIAAFIALNESLIAQGVGDTAEVGIVLMASPIGVGRETRILDFDSDPNTVRLTATPNSDSDGDGTSDVEQLLRSIESGGQTAFKDALGLAHQLTVDAGFDDPSQVNVVFLSDGSPFPIFEQSDFTDELTALSGAAENVRAFGVGASAGRRFLRQIDRDTQVFESTDEIVGVFGGLSGDLTVYTEAGTNGIAVELLDAGGNVVATQATASVDLDGSGDIDPFSEQGLFSFDLNALGLPETGDYSVRVAAPQGTRMTTPLGGTTNVTVAAGSPAENFFFGTTTAYDFGDAPTPYPTTLAADGARHVDIGPTFGATRDFELDGTPSTNADADGSDEDGISFGPIRVGALGAEVTVNVQGGPAKLDAWIDFDGDGNWSGANERIFASVNVVEGPNVLTFDVPADARLGTTVARFRLSTAGGLDVRGEAADGEVEDHLVTIAPPAPSTGVLGPAATIGVNGGLYEAAKAADLDGDGDLDFIGSGAITTGASLAWFENDGAQNFTEHTVSVGDFGTNSGGATHVALDDVDGDGDLDIVAGNRIDQNVTWYENDGAQNFTEHEISTEDFTYSLTVLAGDFDNDGDRDIVNLQDNSQVVLYENDGSQNFTPTVVANSGNFDLAAVDVDGDGLLDLIHSRSAPGGTEITWLRNTGDLQFTATVIAPALGVLEITDFAIADLDGDGDADIVTTGNATRFYQNDGGGVFTPLVLASAVVDESSGEVVVADRDGDGDLDILRSVTDRTTFTEGLEWLVNDGSQNFVRTGYETTVAFFGDLSVADVDGDGDLDAVTAFQDATTFENLHGWHRNNDAPILVSNSLTVAEGGTVVLSSADLSATDTDDPDTALTYDVSTVSGGQFELVASPGTAVTSFTQQQVDDGAVQFVHDGNEPAPSYTLTLGDGLVQLEPLAATISYSNVNDGPVVASPLGDVTVDEDAADTVIDLSGVFADVDTAGLTLLATSSDGSLVTATVDGTDLVLSLAANASGTATITVSASDGEFTATDTFTVTVNALDDDAPVVVTPLGDVTLGEDAAPITVDLTGAFDDPDGQPVTLTVTSDAPGVVDATLDGTDLTLTPQPDANGSVTITVTATDPDGNAVAETFTVEVTAANDAPVVATPLGDVTVDEDAADTVIDLSGVFADVDGDTLTYSAVTSDGTVVGVSVVGDQLTLAYPADASGTATITVSATDGQFTATDTFNVNVMATSEVEPGVSVEGRVLSIIGTDQRDHILVKRFFGSYFVFTNIPGERFTRVSARDVDSIYVDGRGGDDHIIMGLFVTAPTVLLGGDGDDHILGGFGDDFIDGGAGNDRLFGSTGNDILNGGAGNDRLHGGWGDDLLIGGDGRDRLYGHHGRDVLFGGDGADRLYGQRGQDMLVADVSNFDDDIEQLEEIHEVWLNGRSTRQRQQDILDLGLEVVGDGDRDCVFGGPGCDWFLPAT